jgi:predicted nuclease of predicted toxin-antitoxin system
VKLLFDANLSPVLVSALQSEYPESVHVVGLGLGSAEDENVWSYAKENNFVVVSKDADFYEMSLVRGVPPKVIWIRIGNCPSQRILQYLLQHKDALEKFSKDPMEAAFFIS